VAFDHPGEQVVNADEAASGSAVTRLLLSRCTADGLAALLACEVGDTQAAAAVCLGLKGGMSHCRALATLLRHGEPQAAQLAEDSLWRIWMRAGTAHGNALLARALDLIREERYVQALRVLTGLCAAEPRFAEAHNQRGIALCFLDRHAEAAAAFRLALRWNRYHFSAAASLGHTYAERCDAKGALRHYRFALHLNPRLDGILEMVKQLEAAVGNGSKPR
jgi:tetratricopeptide (TPR) repeat protein